MSKKKRPKNGSTSGYGGYSDNGVYGGYGSSTKSGTPKRSKRDKPQPQRRAGAEDHLRAAQKKSERQIAAINAALARGGSAIEALSNA